MSQAARARQQRLLKRREQAEATERAEIAREQHLAFRKAHERAQRERRSLLTLGRRVDMALIRARSLSHASGALMERTSRGKPGSSPPPSVGGPLYASGDDLVSFYERRLRLLIESFEREVDAHRVRPLVAELSTETAEEAHKRLIEEFEGLSPAEVVFLDPSWSRVRNPHRAVERARIQHQRRPQDGRPAQS